MPPKLRSHIKPVKAKGKTYLYFRTGVKDERGREIIKRLPDASDKSFGGTYAALLAARARRADAQPEMTVTRLAQLWEKSPKFATYAPGTQKLYRISLDYFMASLPTAPAGLVEQSDIMNLADAKASTPGAANSFIRTVRSLYKWARERGHVQNDPARNVPEFEVGEHQPWPENVLSAALKTTKTDDRRVRLAVHLLYYTAQRIEDVVRLKWTDIKDGAIHLVQMKTGLPLQIHVHAKLAAELRRHKRVHEHIIPGFKPGRPLHQQTLREEMQSWVRDKFGLEIVPHGLRKNAVNTLLEVGCTVGETSAISGQSLKMVEHYAKSRAQGKLAKGAMDRWEASTVNKRGTGKRMENLSRKPQ